MSRGVHAVQHEMEHKIQHDEDHGGGLGGISVANKRMALVIAVLALFLAFAETAGKSAQTTALNAQIEASEFVELLSGEECQTFLECDRR